MLEGLIGSAVFGFGFIAGISASFYLIERYRKDATFAVEQAKHDAYNAFIQHLNEQYEKVKELDESGTDQPNVHDSQEEYEQAMKRLG